MSRQITTTDELVVVPSGYADLTSMTQSNVTNGYGGIDSTTYAQFTLSTSTTGYIYYTFDCSAIPAGASITSVAAQARCRVSNASRVTNTQCQLFAGTTAKGSNVTFASTSSSNIATLSPGNSWTRSELTNLRIKIGGTGSSSTSSKYIRFYGATVTINYSVSGTEYEVTISNSTSATCTVDNQYTLQGGTATVTIDTLSNLTVKDNGTDVTSQFVQQTSATESVVPESNANSNFTLASISNAYDGADSTTYATLTLAGQTTGTLYLDMADPVLPSGATVQSVTVQATVQFSRNNSSSGFTSSMQMYASTTAKGSATQWVNSATDVAKTTYTLTVGSWTSTELANARLCLTATNSASQTQRLIYVYGVTMAVTYEYQGTTYAYAISNIGADHAIVVSSSASGPEMWVKANGSWAKVSTAYRKVSGSWTQVALDSAFQSGVNYVRSE